MWLRIHTSLAILITARILAALDVLPAFGGLGPFEVGLVGCFDIEDTGLDMV
jgi:hypothetical protein